MSAARRLLTPTLWLLAIGALCGTAPPVGSAADPVKFGPYDLRSVFHVEKSENQNQVHYGVRLDAECRPVGKAPVFAYWRRLKKGLRVDDPLIGAGVRVYGASDKQTISTTTSGSAAGSHVEMYVKALKRVLIDVHVVKTKNGCQATPTVTLNKERAKLLHAFLQLGRFGLTVKYVDVVGLKERDGQRITERFDN